MVYLRLAEEEYSVEEGNGWREVCVEMQGRAVAEVIANLSTTDVTAQGEILSYGVTFAERSAYYRPIASSTSPSQAFTF